MSSSRYEQYETYGPTGGADATTVVVGVTGVATGVVTATGTPAIADVFGAPDVSDVPDASDGEYSGYPECSGYAEYARYEPYGQGPPDPYRPAYEARVPEPSAPNVPRAPGTPGAPGAHGSPGTPGAAGARAVRGAPGTPDAPTEPRLPRQSADGRDGPDGVRAAGGRAEARHAARRKRATERPDSLRRLLPQALVVAFLAGGTSAFVANDKAIELSVDGRPRALHTFADDVTELLADEGVKVGAHDVVAPAPGTALTNGDEVAVRYGRPMHLTLDGEGRRVWTTAHTVEGALRQLGVRAEGAYVSTSRSQRIGREGLALDVRTERTVTIMADGRARTIRTNAASVGEAVEEAGITLHGQDTTSVAAGSFPRDGQTVTVLRVTGTREVREEPIPFQVRRADDSSLFKGIEVVERAGQYGALRVTYTLRTVNGVKQRPRLVRSEVVRKPQAQLVRVGTKPHPPSVGGADHLNWSGLAACESGGRPGAVDPSGTYGGLYQFDTRTWHALGGSGRPQDASAAEQTLRAKKLYVRRGASPWPHCGPRLHG
ncbi:ubiquitin-like domain-containing protein [Streptomyces sp. NPDC002685]|uniref:ubiquitin-like domain-containing protein n=1 Tax=Streptomyces sp. NPDC002685 TaxID=3154540 RepID=UPI003316FF77